jgi:hypothetical protein
MEGQSDSLFVWNIPARETPLVNVFTFGWMEDGRLGFPPDNSSYIQSSPRPIPSLRQEAQSREKLVCKNLSAGSRHTLMVMVSCNPESPLRTENAKTQSMATKLYLTGLNQLGLCEEPGSNCPVQLEWRCEEDPMEIVAAHGNCFVITKFQNVFSWGHGRFGCLGHCTEESTQVPRQIQALRHEKVKHISAGAHHVVVCTSNGKAFSWGKNHKGQLGRGSESPQELSPAPVLLQRGELVLQVACGFEHTIALVNRVGLDGSQQVTVFGWGDESKGQLGSGDALYRSKPQENRWITRFLTKNRITVSTICAGGYHNLLITCTSVSSSGQVVSWGAGGYGQLGSGFLWDDPRPTVVNGLESVVQVSAGMHHSMALVSKMGANELYGWGYNGYGELGLGDTDMRIIPTAVSALSSARVMQVSCGDRHTAVRTSHKPVLAKEDPNYRPFYQILEEV